MKISEIFKSIQGESTLQGLPCVFIRLWGCNLRCSYCDTRYAYEGSYKEMSIEEVLKTVESYKCDTVEITGGEPLLQEEVYPLSETLVKKCKNLLLETNGSIDIQKVHPNVKKIMDIKCPSSGMSDKIYWDNLHNLNHLDEVKFVLSNKEDYEWAKDVIKKYSLNGKVAILFGMVFGKLPPEDLSEWILRDNLNVRLQLQLHKYIWPHST